MNKFYLNFAAIVFLGISLAGCSSTDDEDEATRVAELVEIKAQFEPETVWTDSVGDGVDDYFSRIKPEIAYGKIFAASREGEVVAFDKGNGKTIWQQDLSDIDHQRGFFDAKRSAMIAGGPTAGMNKVFLGTENGDIFALEEATGKLVWRAKVNGEVIAKPAFGDGVLVVNTSAGIIKAFNADDGKELWKVEQEVPPLTLRGVSPPVIASGGVLVGSPSGNLDVYILQGGQQGWSVPVGEASGSTELERVIDVDSSPVIFGDKIFSVASRGNLVSIDLRSGRTTWKRQYSSYRQIAVKGNSVYLTDVKGHIYAVDRNNGVEKWAQISLTNRGVTGPVVVGNYLVVGDFEGYLHWLDQETGEIVARNEVDGSGVFATPVSDGEIVVAQSRDGDIAVFKVPN